MKQLEGKRVLITGGTGSLGTALVKYLLTTACGPSSIKIFSRDELKQHEMRLEHPSDKLDFMIGDVGDYPSVASALQDIDIVFHAAALKQVGACEDNPEAAVRTNIGGAVNIVRAIRELRLPIHTVVGVSSDKGCQPVNVYGATKLLQERMLLKGNDRCSGTRFVCVCYGNVMASRGSVIEVWQRQIRCGQPVTITNPDMTRFLISLDQAVDTLIAVLDSGKPGEVYVPANLPAATVGDIADVLIGNHPIRKKIIGVRSGEKMHEILIPQSEVTRTLSRNNYYVVSPAEQSIPAIRKEYTSSDFVVNREELHSIFKHAGLLISEEILT